MKRRIQLALIPCAVIVLGSALRAALIGIGSYIALSHPTPDVFFITNNLGPVTYTGVTASSGLLAVNSTPTQITLPTLGIRSVVASTLGAPTVAINIKINTANASSFTGDGSPDDFRLTGTVDLNGNGVADPGEPSDVLLTGGLIQFGWTNPTTPNDTLEFRFMPTGGSLLSYFAGQDIGVSLLVENDNWPAGTGFTAVSFIGSAKGDVVPIAPKATIGDLVWNDLNGDGVQQPGEPGINGVTVQLKDTFGHVIGTQVTRPGPLGQNGFYQFSGLCGATYTVSVTTPGGGFVASPSGAGGDSSLDSSDSPATVTLPVSTGTCTNQTIDFGYRPPSAGTIGDFVWHDLNRNGLQDDGPGSGIEGVTVRLERPDSSVISTTTGPNGAYQFTGLAAGTYRVDVDALTLPAGFTPTLTLAEGAEPPMRPADSNPAPAVVVLDTGTSNETTIDFGYVNPCTGSIGDVVWFDDNHNGLQDPNEMGIDGLTITLNGPGGARTTTTGPNGNDHGFYQFTGLCAGTYTVTVTAPAGFVQTTTGAGAPAFDSNGSPATVTLIGDAAGDTTIDIGYTSCPGTIGNWVWQDLNLNGLQESGEPGLAGVQVALHRAADYAVLQTATTGADGTYLFQGVCPGDYKVEVVPPAGMTASPAGAGSADTDSNGVNPASPVSLTLANTSDLTIDFGFRANGTIGDFVWSDLNGDGIQNSGEPGIGGVTVTLVGPNGTLTTTTSASGAYQFTNLTAGTYSVSVSTPAGLLPTLTGQGTLATDSNNSPATVTLAAHDASDQTIDFGFKGAGSIGNFVWSDLNGNGIQDGGEAGLAGVTVTLTGSNGTMSTTTDASGLYQFTNLIAGSYTVTVTTPVGYEATSSGQGGNTSLDSNVNPASVTLATSSSSNQTIDFGFYTNQAQGSGFIGDFVWYDVNGNGIQDSGEPGIGGVTLSLTGPGGPKTVTTAANGSYHFDNLTRGNYTVTVATPAGYTLTGVNAPGSTVNTDSNASGTVVNLPLDISSDMSLDFGFKGTGSIGNFVWLDSNGSGIQDSGENGINGVAVTLNGPGGTRSTTTNASGAYLFANLAPGTYTVTAATPAGMAATGSNVGSNRAVDSNGSPATVTLSAGASDATIDFGFKNAMSIGDLVWLDSNGNGLQDSGEPGLSGVTVTLKRSNNTTTTTTTDANGLYQFSNLTAGTYTITVTTPSNLNAASTNIGTNRALDSNSNPSTVTLTAGGSDQTIDFGFRGNGSIGDRVWSDVNSNGLQDSSELGISGVTVTLTGPEGTLTTTTNSSGYYQFTNLVAGAHTVTATTPAGLVASPTLVGTNRNNDSNVSGATVTLANNSSNDQTIDFGFASPPCIGRIGDFIWYDLNGNGIQNSGEAGIPNLTVQLKNSGGSVIQTVTTASNGAYQFTGLCAGSYTVVVPNPPAGYISSPSTVGSDRTIDSNANSPALVTLSANNSVDTTIDLGFMSVPVVYGKIGDFVWLDVNGNGIQDTGEPGISGITVTLKRGTSVIATQVTGAGGGYLFSNVPYGSYTVVATTPSGLTATASLAGYDRAKDSNGASASVMVSDSTPDYSIDFGFRDTVGPACPYTIQSGPPTKATFTVTDFYGISKIQITQVTNFNVAVISGATTQTAINTLKTFTVSGTPVSVVATRINGSQGASLTFVATDVYGNVTNCDPTVVTLGSVGSLGGGRKGIKQALSETGRDEITVVENVPAAEHFVTIQNNTPGLNRIELLVNDKWYRVQLANGQTINLDIAEAMKPDNTNRIAMAGRGSPQGTATITIADIAF